MPKVSIPEFELISDESGLLQLAVQRDPSTKDGKVERDEDGHVRLKPTQALLLGEEGISILIVSEQNNQITLEDNHFSELYTSLLHDIKTNNKKVAQETFSSLIEQFEKTYGNPEKVPHLFIICRNQHIDTNLLASLISTANSAIEQADQKKQSMQQRGNDFIIYKNSRRQSNAWEKEEAILSTQNKKHRHSIIAACVSAIVTMASGITVKLLIDSPSFLLSQSWQATLTANPGILAASILAALAGSATIVALVFLFAHLKQKTSKQEKAKGKTYPPKAITYINSATKAESRNRRPPKMTFDDLKPRSLNSDFNSVAKAN